MSSVKTIVALTFVAFWGCASVAVSQQHEDAVAISDQSGILVLAEEDQAPMDNEQGMFYALPDENNDSQDPAEPESGVESDQEDHYYGNPDFRQEGQEPTSEEPDQLQD